MGGAAVCRRHLLLKEGQMGVRGENKERSFLIQIVMLVAVFVICCIAAITILTPTRYDVKAGDIAQETIVTPGRVEYTAETEAQRELARSGVSTVYVYDEAIVEGYVTAAEAFFENITTFRSDAAALRASRASALGIELEGTLSINQWKAILTNAELQQLLSRFELPLSTDEGWWLLHVEASEILRLSDIVLPKIKTALESGLRESQIEARKTACIRELQETSLSDEMKAIGEKVFEAYLQPTQVEDAQATEQAREEAAAAVEPVMLEKGALIVAAGDVITQQQYDFMRSLELVRADNADLQLYIGIILYMLIVGACFVVYMLLFRRDIFANRKKVLIISVSIALSILLALATSLIDRRICTSLIGVLLVALLVDRKVAMMVNAVLALCIGLFAGGRGSTMLGYDSLAMVLSIFAGGQAAIYFVRRYYKRGSVITAGLFSGAAAALIVLAADIMVNRAWGAVLLDIIWAFGSNVIAAVLVVGSLSLWENLFDVATSARLNELSNANNPLMRQLMTEAPGTYHHSMMVAALSEAAAEAIEADALLARVGAYYHDVGKLRRPLYFKENQKPGENIHDTLPPGESAMAIIAHQKDGVTLLMKNKLPPSVVQIAYEHHGNTLAAYFYHKATQMNEGKQLPQKLFRYPGARPGTKESAIVMLADSCEAAVRSLDNPDQEAVESLVEKVIKGKIDDNQLAACPLTFKEVTAIRQSFLRTFKGMLHERIAYPGQEQGGEKKD